jgi:hypothetical protein
MNEWIPYRSRSLYPGMRCHVRVSPEDDQLVEMKLADGRVIALSRANNYFPGALDSYHSFIEEEDDLFLEAIDATINDPRR